MNCVVPSSTPRLVENSPVYDVFIVGGGINGTGIAADAAGRGLSVALCEQADLASATSSASSKLIHGGLRYLEHYEFRLVREALSEREVLLRKAPHLIAPLRFILPHQPHLRPAWMIRIGLFMYDHLSTRNQLPASHGFKLQPAKERNPLKSQIDYGFEYSDCRVDDARLVIGNALAAQQHGARVMVRTRCLSAQRHQGLWHIWLEDILSGEQFGVRTRSLINAAGPWAQQFIEQQLQATSPRKIRLIKGSHFVTRKLYEGDQAYILQNADQRIVFVIPYNQDFTLVGTTDKRYDGDPANVAMDEDEERYLLKIVNEYFQQQISSEDILWRYSGVRPLCDDESESPSAMTRDYTLELQTDAEANTPLLSIFGGKITTYRRLAEAACQALKPFFTHMGPAWTHDHALPGGDIGKVRFADWQQHVLQQYAWLPATTAERMTHAYGTRIHQLLQACTQLTDLGRHFGHGLYQREVEFLLQQEWARNAEDIVWRRSKLGLYLGESETAALQAFVSQQLHAMATNLQQSTPVLREAG